MTRTEAKLRAHPNVEHVDDERGLDNGIIVTLQPGLGFQLDKDCGVRAFDSFSEALLESRQALQKARR